MSEKVKIRHVNAESDFAALFEFTGREALPTWPWSVDFWTERTREPYRIGFDGVNYTRCAPVPGYPNQVLAEFNTHNFGCGILRYNLVEQLPSGIFEDDDQTIATPDKSQIQIWSDLSDDGELPPVISAIVTGFLRGKEGFSPVVEVLKGEGSVRLRITDAEGAHETENLLTAYALADTVGDSVETAMTQRSVTAAIAAVDAKIGNIDTILDHINGEVR